MWNLSTRDCECNKACEIDGYLDIKKCLCKKRLFVKLVLACEDEILNTAENSFNDKKLTCEKSNCLIHTISLVIICLLLLSVISISCYFYHLEYRSKQKILSPFQDINNKFKGIDY